MTAPRARAAHRRRAERGSGSVLVVAAVAVLLVLTIAGTHLGAAAAAAHRARTAADLSALAGASAIQEGNADACSRAAAVTIHNGGQLVSCALGAAETVTVTVRRGLDVRWPGVPDHATASARAGPADLPP